MSDPSTEVQVWSLTRYKGKRKTSYSVRWRVGGRRFHRTFATSKLAESFRSSLVVAITAGTRFDSVSGLPVTARPGSSGTTWLEHAAAFVDVKWPRSSPRHRQGLAEGLVTTTIAVLPRTSASEAARRRAALSQWAFNTGARSAMPLSEAVPPSDLAGVVRDLQRKSPRLEEMTQPTAIRAVLEALTLKLDGTPAAPSTVARKRSALYSALEYAVEVGALATNPITKFVSRAPAHTDVVDRRVVVNPTQAATLLEAVDAIYPSLTAFFACIYYSALRPSEVRHLRLIDLDLPEDPAAWGSLNLAGSTQTTGAQWSDDGTPTQDRALKHRARRATRIAPAPPELGAILRRHLRAFPAGVGGRIFVTRAGRSGVPVAPPYASPQSMGIVYRVWDLARRRALTPAEYDSLLAKRPYDLRHAAVSLWLNAGVPATQVAEWAGHSVNVLLRVYASCVVGQDEASRLRVEAALHASRPASRSQAGDR